jgi:hypothetical protein
MSGPANQELFPGDFAKPVSVFIHGSSRPLLKWVALALLAPYASRAYWTDIRLEGEALEPLDPLALHVVPEDHIHVIHPREMERNEQEAQSVAAATATMVRSDAVPQSLRQISEFLQLPEHSRARVASVAVSGQPAIMIVSNAHHFVGIYPRESVGPIIHAIVESGICLFVLWTGTPPPLRSVFDVVLNVEGSASHWRAATLACEQGISTGPLGPGKPCPLGELPSIARVLEKSIPDRPAAGT